jgi:hypothetical protein
VFTILHTRHFRDGSFFRDSSFNRRIVGLIHDTVALAMREARHMASELCETDDPMLVRELEPTPGSFRVYQTSHYAPAHSDYDPERRLIATYDVMRLAELSVPEVSEPCLANHFNVRTL